ncbi:MAG: hypothetical protein R3330_14255, partial [Saprospiraceae bacterium]|nr:hypothetical protein [Saprospiraceae bacterium]
MTMSVNVHELKSILELPHDAYKPEVYLSRYETRIGHMRLKPVRLLELGVFRGESITMWQQYFHNGVIAGLDYKKIEIDGDTDRIHLYQGMQQDTELLTRIAEECAPEG